MGSGSSERVETCCTRVSELIERWDGAPPSNDTKWYAPCESSSYRVNLLLQALSHTNEWKVLCDLPACVYSSVQSFNPLRFTHLPLIHARVCLSLQLLECRCTYFCQIVWQRTVHHCAFSGKSKPAPPNPEVESL